MKVRDILLSRKVKTQKIEHIKAFSFWDYHTEKKTYLQIYTNGTDKRKQPLRLFKIIIMKSLQMIYIHFIER